MCAWVTSAPSVLHFSAFITKLIKNSVGVVQLCMLILIIRKMYVNFVFHARAQSSARKGGGCLIPGPILVLHIETQAGLRNSVT